MLKIEKNVPVPLGAKVIRTALSSMSAGDSFLVAAATENERSMIHREMKAHRYAFTSRTEGEGMRVWRLA
jgi:predicted solute-binding protein